MTLRVKILKLQDKKDSTNPNAMTNIYKIELVDIEKKGYLVLKYLKAKKLNLGEGNNFLVDRIKLIINKKREIVLISTSLTVLCPPSNSPLIGF